MDGSTPRDGPTERRLRAALDAAADAVVIADAAGTVTECNRAAERLSGTPRGWALDRPLRAFASGCGAGPEALACCEAALRGTPGECVATWTRADGSRIPVHLVATPIADATGRPAGVTLVARADEAGARTRLLADASRSLSASLDLDVTLAAVGDLLVPAYADAVVVALHEGSGSLRLAALRHADPAREQLAETVFDAVRDAPSEGGPLAGVMAGGGAVLVERFEAHPPAHLDALTRTLVTTLGLRSLAVVGLRTRGELVGVLLLATTATSGRRLVEADLSTFDHLAERAAQAIEHARLFAAAQAAQERFRAAFEHAPIGIALVRLDASGDARYTEVNPALCAITGYARDALDGRPVAEFTHPEDREDERRRMRWLAEGRVEEVSGEKRHVRADGEVRWLHVRAARLEPEAFVVQVQDVTERRSFQDELEHLASHDPLTGVLNRRRFEEELEQELARVRRHGEGAAVLTLDLDNFKHVNDTYGHPVGDELLRAAARALEGRVRATDHIGRLGGDEFGVILSRTTPQAARRVARSLLEELRKVRVEVSERTVRVTASAGLRALGATETQGAGDLLGEADMALYESKEGGRDRLSIIRPGDLQPERARARMRWSERVRDAVDAGSFVLYEQPILRLADDEIDRSELLIRMIDADGEPVDPIDFLAVAERYGHIQGVDRWVVRHAVALLAERQAAGIDLAVEVNLSGESISDAGVVDFVVSEIANADIDPTALTFEVTETAAIGNLERARRLAFKLSELGCGFALDDFGAGFGSFSYLKHLPLSVIKIDGDFIRQLPTSRHDQVTVRAIVDIARGLGKETVAEFVEDAATLELLREFGIDRAQGHHIGRPRLALVDPEFETYAASGPTRGPASTTPSRPRRLTS